LEFVVGRMVARTPDDRLTVDLLPPEIAGRRASAPPATPPAGADPAERASGPRREFSKAEVEQALARNNGIVRRAARELGVARNTLYRLMEKHGIRPR